MRFRLASFSAFAILIAALPAAITAPPPVQLASVAPRAGVQTYNTPVCKPKAYIPVNLGHGNYFNIFGSQAGNMCVVSERHHLSWYVSRVRRAAKGWQYPNISSGIEWGRYTCYDGRSAYPSSKGSQCMRYPVQQYQDGMPVTSVTWRRAPESGNVSYDIWFNREYQRPENTRQDNGAEIMIWLADPGEDAFIHHAYLRTAWVSGHQWDVCGWTMYHNGASWSYVAYVAKRPLHSVSRLWLNQFSREAEAHGELSKYWWLTGIDFGSEINAGGQGFDVSSYSLAGVK